MQKVLFHVGSDLYFVLLARDTAKIFQEEKKYLFKSFSVPTLGTGNAVFIAQQRVGDVTVCAPQIGISCAQITQKLGRFSS
jgi:hypothetical protein